VHEAFVQSLLGGFLDVLGRVEVGPSDLKMDHLLALAFQFGGRLENLPYPGKWDHVHSSGFPAFAQH
jgi:hypothetical protein